MTIGGSGVIQHFEENLRRMIRITNAHEVPMLVLAPPVNLKDCPPFKSEATADLAGEREAERDRLIAEGGFYQAFQCTGSRSAARKGNRAGSS